MGMLDQLQFYKVKCIKLSIAILVALTLSCTMAFASDMPLDTLQNANKSVFVTWLQTYLNMIGYNTGKVDGHFGENTKAVIQQFQVDSEIEQTGAVDEVTWNKICEKAEAASKDRFLVNNGDSSNLLWGFSDHEGKIVLPCIYTYASGFSCGLSRVKRVDGPVEFINSDGIVVFKLDGITDTTGFIDGICMIEKNENRTEIIDMSGRTISELNCGLWSSEYLGAGRIVGKKDGEVFLYSIDGSVITKLTDVKDIFPYSEELASFISSENDQYGYMDYSGNVVLPPIYSLAGDFNEGIAPVILDGVCGYIDHEGIFTGTNYLTVKQFSEGLAMVQGIKGIGRKACGFIDSNMNLVITLREVSETQTDEHYSSLRKGTYDRPLMGGFREGLCGVNDGSGWGFVDSSGEITIPCKWGKIGGNYGTGATSWDNYYQFINGLSLVAGETYEVYYINKSGNVVIDAGIDRIAYENYIVNQKRESAKRYSEDDYKEIAINYLKNHLKNPESLQIHTTTITSGADSRTIIIDYSAMNGFGGYNRETYIVIITASTGSIVSAYSF